MVKSKGVIKISSKMRSKMERSNKNTRTKCNGISITHNTRARQLGEGWSKPGAGSKPEFEPDGLDPAQVPK